MNTQQEFLQIFESLEYLLDETVGIIESVQELPKEAGSPDFFHYYARGCDTSAFCTYRNFADAGGASAHRHLAMAKAIGEVIERYCSAVYEPEELPLTSFKTAPFYCIPPQDFALFSQQQYESADFPYSPFALDTPARWTLAIDHLTQANVFVPAAMVFLPYAYNRRLGELPITQPISTGLASHMSYAEAAISAICEVIERDAFTIAWQAMMAMPQIRTESLPCTNKDLVTRLERDGSKVYILNITMDHGIPTTLAILRNQSDETPALVFAASADLNPDDSIRKSLEEIAHTRRLAQRLKTELPPVVPGIDYVGVFDQDSHIRFYCDKSNSHLADFMLSSRRLLNSNEIECFSTGNPVHDLEILTRKVRDIGHNVLLADVTTPDVVQLGFHVVRAIIPGFHPLFMGHSLRPLGGTRLWTTPQKLGYAGISRETSDNPLPHPYP